MLSNNCSFFTASAASCLRGKGGEGGGNLDFLPWLADFFGVCLKRAMASGERVEGGWCSGWSVFFVHEEGRAGGDHTNTSYLHANFM